MFVATDIARTNLTRSPGFVAAFQVSTMSFICHNAIHLVRYFVKTYLFALLSRELLNARWQ